MNEQLPDRIVSILSNCSGGVSISELSSALGPNFQKRTIQRYLQQLIADELVVRHGRARATRYSLNVPNRSELLPEGYIPCSKRGEVIRQLISKPLTARQPVTYKKSFLYDYIPNNTYYIKPVIREYLKKIGAQPDGNKPVATFANQIYPS